MNKLANYLLIWELLVSYANTGRNFSTLFFNCMNYSGTVGADSLEGAAGDFSIDSAGSKFFTFVIGQTGDATSFCRDVRKGMTLEKGAKKYRQDLIRVLTWITDRNSSERNAALTFLWNHGRDVLIDASLDDDLYSKSIHEYGTVASPICKFILDRIDHYNEGRKFIVGDQNATPDHSYNEDLRREILPLGRCKYCRKFMVIERISKQFCSNLCRAASGQAKKTKHQKAKEMSQYRAAKAAIQESRRKRPLQN